MSSPASPGGPERHGRQVPIAQLRKGDRVDGSVFLVEVANFKQTRNNKSFIQLQLRDRSGSIKAVRWEATHDLFASFATNDFLRIRGRVEEFQQHLQVVVDDLAQVSPESVDINDFLPASERDVDEMERELLEYVAAVQDRSLKALLLSLVEDDEIRQGLRRCPAGKAMHHAYTGGLLEHINSLIHAAKRLLPAYPELNGDLLVAAAIIHDIGKLRELSYTRTFQYTDQGQLIGHIGIGMVLISEKAKAIEGFPQELLDHLLHIIASHHGIPEHGALKLPMTSEAIAFHMLDNLDAKLATMRSFKAELELASQATDQERKWTDYKPALGRKLFFP